ncbi:MAG: hypothetical protein ABI977_07860 [Acidobacteriota bacterium]
MAYTNTPDELLELAFQLAHFIHQNKAIALRIATAALEKLDAADSRQDKRRYYNPSGQRRKVSLPELLLLQRLVYTESEPHEKRKEQDTAASLNQATMVKHFIKHLVKITSRRNSFHVLLGLGRLLHDYSTPETAELHNVVMQDAERVPEDAYYRSRKALLMSEMKDRFGAMLPVERRARGEERFKTRQDSHLLAWLVRECLQAFTPWQTNCCVPERFNPTMDELDKLAFRGNDPDEEHKTEVNRYHAVLHPLCFERLALALRYGAPSTRLAIPQFILSASSDDDDDNEPDSATPPKLGDEDRAAVRRHLNHQSGRRHASAGGLLQFVVNDKELAKLDPRQPNEVSFAIPHNAEFIEIRSVDREGELLLALHQLETDPDGDMIRQQTEIELPGGQSFRLSVEPTRNVEGQTSCATIRAISLAKQPAQSIFTWTLGGLLKPALALVALAAIAGFIFFFASRSTSLPPATNEASFTPAPTIGTLPVELSKPSAMPPAGDYVLAVNIPANPLKSENLPRGERERQSVASLVKARQFYVEVSGPRPQAGTFAAALKQRLQASGKFNLTANKGKAEALLKLDVKSTEAYATVQARIVNANGDVIWPLAKRTSGRKYIGAPEKIAIKLSQEILDDLQRLRPRR